MLAMMSASLSSTVAQSVHHEAGGQTPIGKGSSGAPQRNERKKIRVSAATANFEDISS
jgi:hypothetical protein